MRKFEPHAAFKRQTNIAWSIKRCVHVLGKFLARQVSNSTSISFDQNTYPPNTLRIPVPRRFRIATLGPFPESAARAGGPQRPTAKPDRFNGHPLLPIETRSETLS